MRLAAQIKLGYYPVDPEVIDWLSESIVFPEMGTTILDPCAGDGAAIDRWLMYSPGSIPHTIEMDSARSEACSARFGDLGVHLNSDYIETTSIKSRSIGFCWLNPPYDDEFGGGGRLETAFLQKTLRAMVEDGIIVMFAPESFIDWKLRNALNGRVKWWHLTQPIGNRKYKEVILILKVTHEDGLSRSVLPCNAPSVVQLPDKKVIVPSVTDPVSISKTGFNDIEVGHFIQRSPLNRIFEASEDIDLGRPPLSLGLGHIGLLLPCGRLNGVVDPGNGEPPHVVRGVARKVEVESEPEITTTEKGELKKVTTKTERIELIVRVIERDGKITELSSGGEAGNQDEAISKAG